MSSPFGTNNPGIGGLEELTSVEEALIESLASLGTSGQVLAVTAGEDDVEWVSTSANLTIEEADASPSVSGVSTLVVPNGTLTDDGGGQVTLTISGSGDVTAAAVMTDNAIVRGDGGAKSVQDTGITIDDTDNIDGVNDIALDTITADSTSGGIGIRNNAGASLITVGAGGTSSTNIGLAGSISSSLHAAFTDYVQVNGNATNAGRLRLGEDTDNGSNYVEIIAPSSVAANRTLTLPDADDTVVGRATTDTLTNKTIDGDNNTITNLDIGNEVEWALIGDVSDASAFESGDKVLIFEAGVGMRKVDYDDLPSGGGGLDNVVEDTTPQLGGNLDTNTFDITGGSGYIKVDGNSEWVSDGSGTLTLDFNSGVTITGDLIFGTGTAEGKISSNGNYNLVLETGNATTGSITITDGADGAINLEPNGTGEAQVNGEKIIDETDTASTTSAGIVELATTAEVDAGTDTGRVVTPDALAGSYAGTKPMGMYVVEAGTDVATGDGAAYFPAIPASMNGMNLVSVNVTVLTAGTTGTTDIQIHNVTQAADMLSTKATIDSGETSTATATTPLVIDTSNDDIATGDILRIDVDAVSTTAPQGLVVTLEFRLP